VRDVGGDRQRSDHVAAVRLSLGGLLQGDRDEHCVDQLIARSHGRHDLLVAPALSSARGLNRGLL
jgi:hypothetical protein